MYKDTIIKYIQFSQILTDGAILREFADLYGSYRLQGWQSTWQYRFWQLLLTPGRQACFLTTMLVTKTT